MPLTPAICTQCGAQIEVDSSKEAAICPSCGTAFIVENAIKNYSITNNIQAQTIYINYDDSHKKDFDIVAGMLKKYTGVSKEVIIPDGVTSIDHNSFSHLPIESIFIPEGVERIESGYISIHNMGAFAGCSKLHSIVFPHSMREIGEHAFYKCTNLVSIEFKSPNTKIRNYAFDGCEKLSDIKFPPGTTMDINELAFGNTLYLKTIYDEREKKEKYMSLGLCSYCGGKFKGIFNKVCSKCNRNKDY